MSISAGWRWSAARIAALLGLRREQRERIALDTDAAKRIGVRIRNCGHPDVVDVHVALSVVDHRGAVVTSDPDDILAADANLQERIIEM